MSSPEHKLTEVEKLESRIEQLRSDRKDIAKRMIGPIRTETILMGVKISALRGKHEEYINEFVRLFKILYDTIYIVQIDFGDNSHGDRYHEDIFVNREDAVREYRELTCRMMGNGTVRLTDMNTNNIHTVKRIVRFITDIDMFKRL